MEAIEHSLQGDITDLPADSIADVFAVITDLTEVTIVVDIGAIPAVI